MAHVGLGCGGVGVQVGEDGEAGLCVAFGGGVRCVRWGEGGVYLLSERWRKGWRKGDRMVWRKGRGGGNDCSGAVDDAAGVVGGGELAQQGGQGGAGVAAGVL